MYSDKKGKPEKKNNAFKTSILKLIELCNKDTTEHYDMFKVATNLNFHKRRFYDVINVLEVIGVCVKLNTDTFLWNGMGNIKETIYKIAYANGAFSNEESLAKIIPNEECISIGKVTEHLILCFLALQEQSLNIKQVAFFLSRDNSREKTTLCKLYQITHVFESMGILNKTQRTSEFRLSDDYFIAKVIPPKEVEEPYSISSLLNRQNPHYQSDVIIKRRNEFMAAQNNAKITKNTY